MKRNLCFAFLLASTSLLLSCDPIYGIERESFLSSMPDVTCIQKVIETTPGITEVSPRKDGGEKDIFGHLTPIVYSYVYGRNKKMLGVISVNLVHDSNFEFRDYLENIGEPPPQEQVDVSRPVMNTIEKRLVAMCGIPASQMVIKEECTGGIHCDPLPP